MTLHRDVGTGFVVLRHPQQCTFVCAGCKDGEHDTCKQGTWCDCQHRKPREGAGRA